MADVMPLRAQQRQFTRARLLDAALGIFAEKGYYAATVEEIVSGAGAARATFYLHFDSNSELVRELVRSASTDADDLFAGLAKMAEVTREGLEVWMGRAVEYWEQHRSVMLVIAEAVGAEPELATDYFATMERSVDPVLSIMARRPGSGDDEMRLRAMVMLMGLERFCYLWVVRRLVFDRALVVRTLTDMWWGELGSPQLGGGEPARTIEEGGQHLDAGDVLGADGRGIFRQHD